MVRPSPEIVDCPQCGARNFAIDDICVVCHQDLTLIILPRPKIRRFRLGSMMILIAVIAICLVPVRYSPWLSLIASVVLVPALVRTFLVLENRRLDGRKARREDPFEVFGKSFLLVLLIVWCSSISCGFTFIFTHNIFNQYDFLIRSTAATIVGLCVFYFASTRLWPERD